MTCFEWVVTSALVLFWWEVRCWRIGCDPVLRWARDRWGRKRGRDYA